MSKDLVAAALWLPLDPTRKLIMVSLCENASLGEEGRVDGECWPSRRYIAARCSLSVRSVTPHIKALERDGWMRTTRRPRPGLATERVLDAKRILEEGERGRVQFRLEADHLDGCHDDGCPKGCPAEQKREDTSPLEGTGEDMSPATGDSSPVEGNLTAPKGEAAAQEGKLTAPKGEAASPPTVRNRQKQPRAEPSSPASAREQRDVDEAEPSTDLEEQESDAEPGATIEIPLGELQDRADHDERDVTDLLKELASCFDAGDLDVQERLKYWSARIPPDEATRRMLSRLVGLLAVRGTRGWDDLESALAAAEDAGWRADFTWNPKPEPVVAVEV